MTSQACAVVAVDAGPVNALDPASMRSLLTRLRAGYADHDGILITGTSRAFCSGFDLEWAAGASRDETHELVAGFDALVRGILDAPVPVTAILEGPSAGGGTLLALACDARLVGERASMRLPAHAYGMPYPPGVEALVSAAVATPLALLSGQPLASASRILDAVPSSWSLAVARRPARWTEARARKREAFSRHGPKDVAAYAAHLHDEAVFSGAYEAMRAGVRRSHVA